MKTWITKLEHFAEVALFVTSAVYAYRGQWLAAQYFIMCAAAVELEEWMSKGENK